MNAGDSWSAARYGVMCVEGYSPAAGSDDPTARWGSQYGFDFWVVDSGGCGDVMRRFTAAGRSLDNPRVQVARDKALRYAATLNRQDRLMEATSNGAA